MSALTERIADVLDRLGKVNPERATSATERIADALEAIVGAIQDDGLYCRVSIAAAEKDGIIVAPLKVPLEAEPGAATYVAPKTGLGYLANAMMDEEPMTDEEVDVARAEVEDEPKYPSATQCPRCGSRKVDQHYWITVPASWAAQAHAEEWTSACTICGQVWTPK